MNEQEVNLHIFNTYSIKKIGKFKFTLLTKFPDLNISEELVKEFFKLYFDNSCRYDTVFYLDVVKILSRAQYPSETLLSIIRYAAIHTLFNKNSILYLEKNTYHVFYRKDNQIEYFVSEDFKATAEYLEKSLKVFYNPTIEGITDLYEKII